MEEKENLTETEKQTLMEINQMQYVANHERILQAWEDIYNEKKGKRPTFTEIGERIGISRQTVAKHLKDATFELDVAPKHMMNINPMLDEFYALLQDPTITPYAKGKLILDYIKLIGNPTEKKEVKQMEATKLFIEISDNKNKKTIEDAIEATINTDESK